ncbi:hypothetical protein FHR75_003130 [Kineococcus radiotolerans]|uniref:Secreted protein n=1 Tax=Kineococcus radiotolerans TaxID=131568 RepID=A0A7W4XYI4_KINRA|nr:hypothetical protein [Kineococcus radiotolerans]MBB2902299.1 hypothetical protein [Kineococcus radiotolerans]
MVGFSHLRRTGVLAAAVVLALAVTPSASAAPPAPGAPGVPGAVARGTTAAADWSVTPVGAGSWDVELRLPSPVPLRAAQPQLAVDGTVLGVARQGADGRTLTLRTTDPRAARAGRVQLAWNGVVSGDEARTLRHAAAAPAVAAPAPTGNLLAADPATRGRFRVQRADYDLGDTALRLPGLAGQAVEQRAAVYLPAAAPGPRPVVVFLHGRHQACFGGTVEGDFGGWPCTGGSRPVPSHLGYGEAAEALASQGYAVVSISADGVNALDWGAEDGGAQARGELVLAHLDLLRSWTDGRGGKAGAALRGRLDLADVGLMGHSRGGEGVVRAALLNAERPDPYGVRAVMPLAPVDFARSTLPGTAMAVVLPYCDGDVSDQQGQHFHDDTRYAARDDVLRTSLLVMGANHNYFNSEWTPGASQAPSNDDWYLDDDPVCGPDAPGRLTPAEQRAVGTAYVSGFFRLHLGGEQQFLPLFDGTGGRAASAGRAVVHAQAQQPSSARTDLAPLEAATPTVTLPPRAEHCASAGPPVAGQPVRCAGEQRPLSSLPHWTPAWLAPSVPATPVLRARWRAGAKEPLTVAVPRGAVTGVRQALTFRAATPQARATDLVVALTDTAGRRAAVPVSRFSSALRPLPALADPWGGGGEPLAKTWLRTVRLPLDAFPGVDVGRLASVTFTPTGAGADVYLSDVALDRPASGTGPTTAALPAVSIGDVQAFEDDGTQRVSMPLTLSRRSKVPVTVEVDTAAAAVDGRVAARWRHVTIPAGSLTGRVVVPLVGDDVAGEALARLTVTLSVPRGAVVGDGFGTLSVYDDDLWDESAAG